MIGPWTLAAVFLAEVAVKSAAILLVANLAARFCGRRNAALRHLLLVSGLVLALLVPIVTGVLPTGSLWRLDPFARVEVYDRARQASRFPGHAGDAQGSEPAFEPQPIVDIDALRSPEPRESVWPILAAGLWAAGTAFVLVRMAFSIQALSVLTRCTSVETDAEADRLAASIGLRRSWTLRGSVAATLPGAMTWGLRRPVVLLPRESAEWTPDRRRSVLLHELAHVKRFDYLSQLLAELACAAYWFNPLAWSAARELRRSAESAADDVVLRSGVRASDYASTLLDIAADLRERRQPFAPLGVSSMSETKIENRLRAVLASNSRRRGVTSLNTLSVAALAVASLGTLGLFGTQTPPKGKMPPQELERREKTLKNVKYLCIATLLYARDYDDFYPYGTTMATVKKSTMPYAKSASVYDSPTPGGKYVYNFGLSGVRVTSVAAPAEAPLWIEILPDKKADYAVGYADGHVKMRNTAYRPELDKQLRKKYPRIRSTKKPRAIRIPKPGAWGPIGMGG